jgi:hypothetical protein
LVCHLPANCDWARVISGKQISATRKLSLHTAAR